MVSDTPSVARARDDEHVAVLTFLLNGHRLGMAAAAIREVVPSATITPLPGAPLSIEGFIDVRGTIAPVFDLRRRLGFPARPQEPEDHLVIARAGERLVVVRVDRAVDLVRVAAEQIEAPTRPDPELAHVAGVLRLPDGLVVIYDLAAFLSSAESTQLAAALAAVEAL